MRFFALVLLLAAGCPSGHSIPRAPEPLATLNTEWDDYNSAPPPSLQNFVWSTNRGSQGAHFDLWTASGTFNDGFRLHSDGEPRPLLALASPGNELGPIYPYSKVEWWNEQPPIVFASDRSGGQGGLDLYIAKDDAIEPLRHLNGPANDAYWTAFQQNRKNPPAAYFASDRAGNGYDIFEISWGDGEHTPFGSSATTIRRVDELNSEADDTAPFAVGYQYDRYPYLLFASNRAGGEGGFDLYYSRYRDGRWEKPKNLGTRFNTKHNEFRPAHAGLMIIFSSDRPGGKGGYDLYRARIPELR